MSKYILSTFAHNVAYTVYGDAPMETIPPVKKNIVIKGGAKISSLTSGFGEAIKGEGGQIFWTAEGLVTVVSDEDYGYLVEHPIFKKHLAAGFVKPVSSSLDGNHNAIKREARSMAEDPHAPLTKDSIDKRIKVTTGGADQDGLL